MFFFITKRINSGGETHIQTIIGICNGSLLDSTVVLSNSDDRIDLLFIKE